MPKKPKQFRGTSKRKNFYDRKIRPQGFSVVVSLGKVLPSDWTWTRIHLLDRTDKTVTVMFERLEMKGANAPTATDDSASERNS